MEKQQQHRHHDLGLRPKQANRPIRLGLAVVLTGCLALSSFRWAHSVRSHVPYESALNESVGEDAYYFDWDRVIPKPDLEYQTCYPGYGDFSCARLELPMDYWNSTTNASIALAVIRRPAKVSVGDPRYGGAIQVNPGGPGGSGIDFVLRGGDGISWTVDADDEEDDEGKFFDIISFDPRGVGASTPSMHCFENRCVEKSWNLRSKDVGILGSSDASVGRKWSMSVAKGQSCALPPKDGNADIKRYMTTAYVARDMVQLVDAHGEWRKNEVQRTVNGEIVRDEPNGLEKLQYWGFSYGTYLGMTFAAMFPDRVGRLIVDGVVDVEDYKKALWYDNLEDTEKDVDQFYSNCARVGYPACALANATGQSTAEGVKARVQNITNSLYHNPLPVIIQGSPEVVTYSDVEAIMFTSLYSPITEFPFIAHILSEIENGNGHHFAQYNSWDHDISCNGTSPSVYLSRDALMGIACTDGDDQSWLERQDFEKFLKKLQKLSPSIGALWAEVRLSCVHYGIRPEHRFTGPWVGNTSHPILLIGNTADPVTPARNAMERAQGFEGAVALIQDSPGHCSVSAPSNCTVGHVRKYFQTGELPPVNTTCPVDALPFGPNPDDQIGVLEWERRSAGRERVLRINAAMYAAAGGYMGHGPASARR